MWYTFGSSGDEIGGLNTFPMDAANKPADEDDLEDEIVEGDVDADDLVDDDDLEFDDDDDALDDDDDDLDDDDDDFDDLDDDLIELDDEYDVIEEDDRPTPRAPRKYED